MTVLLFETIISEITGFPYEKFHFLNHQLLTSVLFFSLCWIKLCEDCVLGRWRGVGEKCPCYSFVCLLNICIHSWKHADVLSESMRVCAQCVCVCVNGLWRPVSSLPSKEVRENVYAALPNMWDGDREAEDISFVLHLSHNPPLLLHYRQRECPEDACRYDTAATL